MATLSGNLREAGVTAVNTGYAVTMANHNSVLDVTATGGAVAVTLPGASTVGNGFHVTIQRNTASDSNVTVGAPVSATLTASDSVRELYSDGSNWLTVARGGSGESVKESVTISHSFAAGDVLYKTGGGWAKAKADAASTADVIGVVESVSGTASFVIVYAGKIAGLSGLTDGTAYFLSDATAGLLTATEPSTVGHVSRPVLLATGTTTGVVMQHRGFIVPSDQYLTEDVLVHQWLGV
jgi:hypothetical protein